jgi:hypothetical protein
MKVLGGADPNPTLNFLMSISITTEISRSTVQIIRTGSFYQIYLKTKNTQMILSEVMTVNVD